jgi:uncharacterized protein (TIGR03084 family)
VSSVVGEDRQKRLLQIAADYHDEHMVLDGMVGGIGDDVWATRTPSEGWTVADQVNHLAYFDERAHSALTDPDGFTKLGERDLREGAARLDEHLDRGRAMSPGELLEWSRAAHERLMGALDDVDPEARIPWYGPAMSPSSFVTARLMETWAHGRDVADALGVTPAPTDRLHHIADLGVRTRGWSYRVRGQADNPTPVRVELDGPSGECWTWGPDDAADRIEGPAEDFCLVVTQRWNVRNSALVCTGDAATEWMQIAQAYAGAPGTGR